MKQSDFQEQYHWMTGLSEYFNAIGNNRYELLYKALYHNNWYRKRDILSDLIKLSQGGEKHVKAWMNLLLHEHLEDIEIKPQLVVTLLRKYMLEDPLLVNTARFVDYWSGENGEAADMPDINDFLSRGQVLSKLWLVRELSQIVDGGKLGNVVFYGGWYNFIAHFLFQNFDVDTIVSVDLDERVVEPSKRLYQTECKEQRFIPIANDVSKLRWNGRKLQYVDAERRQEMIDEWTTANQEKLKQYEINKEEVYANFGWRNVFLHPSGGKVEHIKNLDIEEFAKDEQLAALNHKEIHCVINTSCEHMDNTWFENLPSGTFVVLHQNDYFDNPQHVNCCKDIEDVKRKYPMQEIYFEGSLDTFLYNRFMLIGVK